MKQRYPAVAGTFYPAERPALLHLVEHMFGGIKNIRQDCLGVVSPHAGLQYSGKTAAYAISSLRDAETFIILGPNHGLMGDTFVSSCLDWKTPLGTVPVNKTLADSLGLACDEDAHLSEHSIEVQLPFLQYRFRKFDFVPVSVRNADYSSSFLRECRILGKRIAKTIEGKPVGIIASSDFSHYLPKEEALKRDSAAIKKVLAMDTGGFFETMEKTGASICGYGPIAVLMETARHLKLDARKIHSSTSADATGDTGSVVAYNAIGFY